MELFVTVLYGSRPCIKSIVTRTSILNVNNGPRPIVVNLKSRTKSIFNVTSTTQIL